MMTKLNKRQLIVEFGKGLLRLRQGAVPKKELTRAMLNHAVSIDATAGEWAAAVDELETWFNIDPEIEAMNKAPDTIRPEE